MSQPKLGVAITADDKTARGVASALGNLKKVPKAANDTGSAVERTKKALDGVGSAKTRGGISAIGRTFSEVDRAVGGAAGGVISKVGGIGKALGVLGTGFGEAATASSAMEAAVTAVGVTAAATGAILVGVAFVSDKLANSWSKGAIGAKNLADTIGISTKALQEFQLAGERVGVDKGTAGGAIGGLSQTLNDAAYGRNSAAIATLAKLGIKLQRNADGTVNTEAMLPQIADAIARQNSSGQRTVANNLGIGLAALPMFRQGGKQLSIDMADSERFADKPEQIALAQRFTRKRAVAGQAFWRAKDTGLAMPAASGEDAFLGSAAGASAEAGIAKGAEVIGSALQGDFKPAVKEFHAAVDRFKSLVGFGGGGSALPLPVSGKITSRFGMRTLDGKTKPHTGVDIAVPVGTQIHAPADGRVRITHGGAGGTQVFLDHGNGLTTGYAHLSHVNLPNGAIVKAGEVFGLSGGARGAPGSGDSRGPHVHWSVIRNGQHVDPLLAGIGSPVPGVFGDNNLGHMRPGGRFASYRTPDDGIAAVARQVLMDEMRGQDTPSKLIGGVPGKDGKLQGGYSPASDGNDVPNYLRFIQSQTGIKAGDRLDPSNVQQLAAIVSAILKMESGAKVDPDHVRVVVELHGLPAAARATARSGGTVAIAHSLPSNAAH